MLKGKNLSNGGGIRVAKIQVTKIPLRADSYVGRIFRTTN